MRGMVSVVRAIALSAALLSSVAALAAETTRSVVNTAYADQDNDPIGSNSIAYPQSDGYPTVHNGTGGNCTYADPVTLAVAPGDFGGSTVAPGTRVYIPSMLCHFVIEDTCAACIADRTAGRPTKIDLFAGGKTATNAQIAAYENTITTEDPARIQIVVNPDQCKNVIVGKLYETNRKLSGNGTGVPDPTVSGCGSTNPPASLLTSADLSTSGWAWNRTGRSESVTATTVSGNASDNAGGVVRQETINVSAPGTFTQTIEFHAGTVAWASIGIADPSGAQKNSWIDLTNGTQNGDYIGSLGATLTVTSKGSGWFEAKITGPAASAGNYTVWYGVPTGQNGSVSYRNASFSVAASGGGTSGSLLTGVNLSASPWAWNRTGRSESVTSTAISADATDNTGGVVRYETITVSSGSQFTYSVEFQAGTAAWASIGVQSPSSAQKDSWVDLTAGTQNGDYTNSLGATLTVTAKGSGWFEAKVTGSFSGTGSWVVWAGIPKTVAGSVNYRNPSFTTN